MNQLADAFFCVSIRLGEQKCQTGSTFYRMKGLVMSGTFFLKAQITGFHNSFPESHQDSGAFQCN